MRITSGIYKNREIVSPKLTNTHPMGERERLALFNTIGNDLTGLKVLDTYAGSGALGMEALSRGATHVTFVEHSHPAAHAITTTLHHLGITTAANLINADITKQSFPAEFDLIFADPPYDNFHINNISNLTKFLKTGGIFVLSHPNATPDLPDMKLLSSKTYARAHLSIYQK